jgi:glycogen synthase
MDGLHRIVKAYSQPRRRAAMQRRGMAIDWSWSRPAAAHVDWYLRLVDEVPSTRV